MPCNKKHNRQQCRSLLFWAAEQGPGRQGWPQGFVRAGFPHQPQPLRGHGSKRWTTLTLYFLQSTGGRDCMDQNPHWGTAAGPAHGHLWHYPGSKPARAAKGANTPCSSADGLCRHGGGSQTRQPSSALPPRPSAPRASATTRRSPLEFQQ